MLFRLLMFIATKKICWRSSLKCPNTNILCPNVDDLQYQLLSHLDEITHCREIFQQTRNSLVGNRQTAFICAK